MSVSVTHLFFLPVCVRCVVHIIIISISILLTWSVSSQSDFECAVSRCRQLAARFIKVTERTAQHDSSIYLPTPHTHFMLLQSAMRTHTRAGTCVMCDVTVFSDLSRYYDTHAVTFYYLILSHFINKPA